MAYARERYTKLLELTNNIFSVQVPGHVSPECSNLGDSCAEEDATIGLFKNSLLLPLPVSTSLNAKISRGEHPIKSKGAKTVSLPTVEALRSRLMEVSNSKKTNETIGNKEGAHLELLFLSQVSCAIQCILIDTILRDIVPLNDSIQDWNRYRGEIHNYVLYGIESLPYKFIIGIRAAMSYDFSKELNGRLLCALGRKISRAPAHQLIRKPLKKVQVEIETKREQLVRLREIYGATLGFVCEQETMLESCEGDSHKIGISLSRSILLLVSLIRNLSAARVHVDQVIPIETKIFNVEDIYTGLIHALDGLEAQTKIVPQNMEEFKPPSVYSRMLLPSLGGVLLIRALGRLAWENREFILRSALEAKETLGTFFKDWVLEPLQDIVKTIRHKDSQFSIMSQASLDSEILSLERMAVDYAAKKGVDPELERTLIRQGNLGTVLKAYEDSIKSPLASALFGDLIQTLLIQAQKTKVDASMALSALDSLLKSNELTFGLIAVIPPLLVTWSAYSFLHRWWVGRLGKSQKQVYRKARLSIGRIFRILNSQIKDRLDSQERYTKQGFLLCEVHYLRQLIGTIPFFSDQDDKDAFLESIRDLESVSLSPQQRLNVVHHISTFYPIPLKLQSE